MSNAFSPSITPTPRKQRQPLKFGPPNTWQSYVLAFLVTTATICLRLSLNGPLGERPTLVLFTLPIMLSAYFGGLRGGLLATALSYLSASYYLLPPTHSLWVASSIDRVQVFALVVAGIFISVLCEAFHRARHRARFAMSEYQASVADRDRFFALSQDLLCILNFDGYFTDLNPAWEKTLGYAKAELLAMPFIDLIHPDDRELTLATAAKVAHGKSLVAFENRYRCKDGSYRHFQWSVTPVLEKSVMYGVARDITERNRTDARFRRLMESNVQGMIFWNIKGEITGANDAFLRIVGYTRDDLEAGRIGWAKMTPAKYARIDQLCLEKLAATGVCDPVEKEFICKDGSCISVFIGAAVFEDSPDEGVSFVLDITERKQTEKSLRESEARFRFLNDLAETTRSLADPAQIMAVMARMLGMHLGASRCAYADVRDDGDQFTILHDYTDGCATTVGDYHLSLFGPKAVATLNRGETLIIRNVQSELLPADGADMFSAIGIQAIITCPLVKEGTLRAMMAVHQATPRDWTAAEIAIVQDVVERCWATIERLTADAARKHAEAEVRRSEAQLHTIIENLNEGVVVTDLNGQLLFSNHAAQVLHGHTSQEECRRLLGELAATIEMWGMDDKLLPRDQWPLARILHGEKLHGVEVSVRKINSDWLRIFNYGGTLVHDAAGQPLMAVLTISDITERKQKEQQIQQAIEETHRVSEELSFYKFSLDEAAIVAVTDAAGTITFVNDKFCQISGYSREELLGQNHRLVNSQFHPKSFFVDMYKAIAQGKVWRGEIRNRAKDGRIYWVDTTIIPTKDVNGRVPRYVAIRADITDRKNAESEVQLLAAIVESTADAVMGTDLNGIVTTWNDAATRIFGYSAAEMIGNSIALIIPEGHREEEERILSKVKLGERVEHFETERRKKDGTLIVMSATVSPIRDSHGRVVGASKVSRDITDRKQAEDALRDSEERFRLLAEGVHDYAIILLDVNGRVVSWNAGAQRLKGFKAEEIVGRSFSVFYPPEDVLAGKPPIELKLAMEQGQCEEEGWRMRADGTRFWANVLLTVLKDSTGKVRGFSKLTRDITDRKVAAEVLFKAGALQRAIFDSANFSSIATDAKGVIQIFNVGAEQMLGYSAAEVMNKITPADISDPKEIIERAQSLSKELGTSIAPGFDALAFKASRGIEDIYQLTYVRKDGTRFPALVSVTALRDVQGAIIGYLLIGTDNTARIEAENKISRWNVELEQRITDRTAELAESNSDLEAFTYSVSHDLRAPLRAIDGFSRIIQTEYAPKLPDEAQRFLGLVRSNVQQMGQLVEDLLSLCRHGRQTIETHVIQPDAIARLAWKDLNQWPDGRNITFDVQALDPCNADPALLKQVFINLLSNAIKFTRSREKALISVGATRDASGLTTYFVSDNGVGFDMRYVHKLFGVFQRLHRAEDYAGTGVGLAIVHRIIKKHGGRVWAHSEPDKGTTISFTLGSDIK